MIFSVLKMSFVAFPKKLSVLIAALLILFLGWIVQMMLANEDAAEVAVIEEGDKNKLAGLANKMYDWWWPKPMEEPKYTFIQRLWMYFK